MAIISDFILRGTRAAQPAASLFNSGFLYCVTDEGNIVERSNGSAWQAFSPVASTDTHGLWTVTSNSSLTSTNVHNFTGLAGANEIMVVVLGITFGSADEAILRVSIDNGSNYLATSGDYVSISGAGDVTNQTHLRFYNTTATASKNGVINLMGCNLTAPKPARSNFFSTDGIALRYVPTANAINAVRVLSAGAQNFTGGAIHVFKR